MNRSDAEYISSASVRSSGSELTALLWSARIAHQGGAPPWSSVAARQGDDLLLRRVRTNLLQLRDSMLGPVLHDGYHRHAEGELVGNDTKLLDPGRAGREFGGVEDLVADAEAK